MRVLRRSGSPADLFILSVRFALGALLLVTGVSKLLDNRGFAGVVGSYQLLPETLWLPTGLVIGLVEFALGIWLLSGHRQTLAAAAAFVLHIGYLGLLGSTLLRGIELDNCGCFGVFWPRPLGLTSLLEDGVLVALALALWAASRDSPGRLVSPSRWNKGEQSGDDG